MYPALFADEADSVADVVAFFVHEDDGRGAGVIETHAPAEHVVAGAARRPFSGFKAHFDRSGVVRAIAPLRDVEMMDAPAGEHAKGEVGDVLVEVALGLFDVVGRERRGAHPALPVDGFRHGLIGEKRRRDAAGHSDLDFRQFAQATVAGEFAGPAEFEVATLLRAELEDDARFAHGGADVLRLGHGHAHGFFMVDVLFVQHGVGGRNAVPVDGQRHQNGVDGSVAVQLAEVGEDLHIVAAVGVFDMPLRGLDALLIHIAKRGDTDAFIRQKRPHVMRALRPAADDAEGDLVRRCCFAAQHAGRHKVRRDARGEHGLKEGAAVVHGRNYQR